MREQELRDNQIVTAKGGGIPSHELRLTGGSAGLLAGKVLGTAVQSQDMDACGDRGAADDNAGIARLDQESDLGGDAAKLAGVQRSTPGPRESASSKFKDDAGHGVSRFSAFTGQRSTLNPGGRAAPRAWGFMP